MVAHGFRKRANAFRSPELEEGQGLVEYALIIALITLVVVSSLAAYGGTLKGIYQHINDSLPF